MSDWLCDVAVDSPGDICRSYKWAAGLSIQSRSISSLIFLQD